MMNTQSDVAEARAQRLQLLALGFTHPTPELYGLLESGDFVQALLRSGAAPGSCRSDGRTESFQEFEAQYIALFQMGKRGRPMVSLNAADHSALLDGGDRPRFLLAYSSWYRHFGLKTAQEEGANELPDHLVCQLEFLCWLSHLHSLGDQDNRYRRAQYDFCKRHLAPFLQALVAALQAGEAPAVRRFYRGLALLALETVDTLLEDSGEPEARSAFSEEDEINVVKLWG